MIFLALKTYKQTTGDEVIKILSPVKKVQEETGVSIIACAQATDVYRIKKELDIEVWAQHIDPIDPGKNTGWISPYSIRQAGATGVLINHSEHKIPEEAIIKTVEKAKQYGLKTMLIGHTVEMVEKFNSFDINFISYEKEDLIASTTSMIDQQEEAIKELIKKLKHPLIIGAGINDGEDVKNPEAKLRELASGFKV